MNTNGEDRAISMAVVYGAFLIVLSMGIALYATSGTKFKVGTCIQTAEREPWDVRQIYRIEMVGKKHYLTRKTPDSLFRASQGIEISFLTAQEYHAVPCPQKG
ncbi:MAG: hypothetical protein KGH87_09125 [Thaumarchaeota archaeon]|nr:hypothetical protein [Nitrososphaerota archaeon]MDE1840066.1 hypothetical protein [Nitrososphaerota archaeon]